MTPQERAALSAMNNDQLMMVIDQLSANSFNGDTLENYNGEADVVLHDDYNQGQPFNLKKYKQKSFAIKLRNKDSAATDRTIAIFPGYFESGDASMIKDSNGNSVAAILTEGTVIGILGSNALVANGKNKSIKELLYFLKYAPTRLIAMKIYVDDQSQFEEQFLFKNVSPFNTRPDLPVLPSDAKDSNQANDNRAELMLEDVQVGGRSVGIYTVAAGRQVDITFIFGASYDTTEGLAQKAKIAGKNIAPAKPGMGRG